MALEVGSPDLGVYSRYKSFGDVTKEADQTRLATQAANIDLQTKAQNYQTQLFSAAAATGDPIAIAAAKAHASDIGLDPSQWSDDPTKLTQQTAAARQALLNPYQLGTIQQAQIANNLKAIDQGGDQAKAMIQPIAGKSMPASQIGNMPAQDAATLMTPPPVASRPLTDVSDPGTPGQINVNIPKETQIAAIDQPITQPAINISPTRTNSPLIQSPQFSFPPNDGSMTNKEYNDARDSAQKAFEINNAPAIERAKSAATETGKQDVEDKFNARASQDIIGLYNKLNTEAKSTPGGLIENAYANATNALNVPSKGAVAKASYDADLNNLYLATIRSLKGTGRVQQSELQKIEEAQPKNSDSVEVKQAKTAAHMDYYTKRMQELGFDPATGNPLGNNQLAPISQMGSMPAAQVGNSQVNPAQTLTTPSGIQYKVIQ